jgi:glycosyltransferase involved in cell wall biosynthesis
MGVCKAFEKLKQMHRYDGSLILAGMPGSGYEVVKEYIDHSEFKNDIVLTGYVNDEELVALYSSCATFVFISLYEGFGIPPLEALSCGAKVIVSNTSSLPEVVGNVGITVDPNNIDLIACAIFESLHKKTDKAYLSLVEHHLKKYDWVELAHSLKKEMCE